MAKNDEAETGRPWIEVERCQVVEQVRRYGFECHDRCRRQIRRPRAAVDVAAHGLYGRDAPQRVEDLWRADVSRVKNQVNAGEGRGGFGPQETMSIRDYADTHDAVFYRGT